MKNLGKVILLIVFLIPQIVIAGVLASVNTKNVQLGDMVTYSLDIDGENIQRPTIYNLCGEEVISTSSSTSIKIINGEYQKSYILSYKFIPKKSCTIKPIEIEINKKIYKTKPIDLVVSKVVSSKDDDFSLSLSADKTEVFVGEPFVMSLVFKHKNSAEAVDSKFIQPTMKGFWVKGESKPIREKDSEFTTTKILYKIAPQREGNLTISSAVMRIASRSNFRESWGSFIPNIKWKSYFSNDLNITAKPLPVGVDLVGDFTIKAFASALEVNANEAVNVNIEVKGNGNLEDIKSFKPYVDGVSIFDEKITIKGDILTQKIAFVGDEDFVIPRFSLKYFDLKTKKIVTISTKEMRVKVKNAKVKQELNIQRDENKQISKENQVTKKEFNKFGIIVAFLIGLISGILIMFIKPFKFVNKDVKLDLKNHKLLLVKLLPYKDDKDVKTIVDTLETNLYLQHKKELDKKLLKEVVKRYGIS
jgi:hypothetical protein